MGLQNFHFYYIYYKVVSNRAPRAQGSAANEMRKNEKMNKFQFLCKTFQNFQ